ncbi:MAG: hypothetical protein QOF33_1024 [Thermomicrobiales bacterium]|jgi:hypothetical protein|nr:hypothetical protein [Thermomicrobiales bacterium]
MSGVAITLTGLQSEAQRGEKSLWGNGKVIGSRFFMLHTFTVLAV